MKCIHPSITRLSDMLLSSRQRFGRESQPRACRTIEHHKLALEEDVPIDGKPNTGIRLDTTEASRSGCVNGSIVDVVARHDSLVRSDTESDAGKRGAASVGVSALGSVERGAFDLGVVSFDDGIGEVEESGSGVGDGVNVGGHKAGIANLVAVSGEFPEAVGGRDGHVGDGTVVLGGVDFAEAVSSWGALLQVGGEERGGEGALGIGEEGFLGGGLDGVDAVKGKAEETVVGDIILELGGDGLGELNSLAADSGLADLDDVGVDIARGGGAVSVSDGPGGASQDFGGL